MTTVISIQSMNTYKQKISSICTSMPWIKFKKNWQVQLLPILRKDQRIHGVITHFKIKNTQSPRILKVTLSFKKGGSHRAYYSIYNITDSKIECENIDINDVDRLSNLISYALGEYSITTVGLR